MRASVRRFGALAWIPAALLCGAALAASPVPIQDSAPSPEDVARGEALYFNHGCYGCHGYSGENGPGARLVGSPRLAAVNIFIQYLRAPVRMPRYTEDVISDAELTDMFAFIRTLPASPEPEDIPLLQELIEEQ